MAAKRRNLLKLVKEDLTAQGWVVGEVETRRGPCSFDLFGVADLLAFCRGGTVLIQVTSRENASSRRKKMDAWDEKAKWDCPGRRWRWLATVDRSNRITYECCL